MHEDRKNLLPEAGRALFYREYIAFTGAQVLIKDDYYPRTDEGRGYEAE